MFYNEAGETLKQVAKSGGKYETLKIRNSKQPDPVEDVPAHCRRAGLEDLQRFLSTQTLL